MTILMELWADRIADAKERREDLIPYIVKYKRADGKVMTAKKKAENKQELKDYYKKDFVSAEEDYEAMNEMKDEDGNQMYTTFAAWKRAALKAKPEAWVEGDEDIAQMMCGPKPFKKGETYAIGEWDGAEGVLYKDRLKEGVMKSLKRAVAGWNKPSSFGKRSVGGDDSPAQLVTKNKEYDDKTLAMLKGKIGEKPVKGSPRDLQIRVIDRELKKRGIKESQLQEFAKTTDKDEGGGDEFKPSMAKLAKEEGFKKGVSLADGATLAKGFEITSWDTLEGGTYKQFFADGWKEGRLDKMANDKKQYGIKAKLNANGSITQLKESRFMLEARKIPAWFKDGAKVKLTPEYADKDPNEVFTLGSVDDERGSGRLSDEQGRGWNIHHYQVYPAKGKPPVDEALVENDAMKALGKSIKNGESTKPVQASEPEVTPAQEPEAAKPAPDAELPEVTPVQEIPYFEVGDTVKPTKGPHKGELHTVIHVFDDGSMNIKPKDLEADSIKYRLGAAKAMADEVQLAEGIVNGVKFASIFKKGSMLLDVNDVLQEKTKANEGRNDTMMPLSYRAKKGDTIEAYGRKGMKNTMWRKYFKNSDALTKWAEDNDATVEGSRELDDNEKVT